jgi:hypothetical protein
VDVHSPWRSPRSWRPGELIATATGEVERWASEHIATATN